MLLLPPLEEEGWLSGAALICVHASKNKGQQGEMFGMLMLRLLFLQTEAFNTGKVKLQAVQNHSPTLILPC
jgi:hypothetical protein